MKRLLTLGLLTVLLTTVGCGRHFVIKPKELPEHNDATWKIERDTDG